MFLPCAEKIFAEALKAASGLAICFSLAVWFLFRRWAVAVHFPGTS